MRDVYRVMNFMTGLVEILRVQSFRVTHSKSIEMCTKDLAGPCVFSTTSSRLIIDFAV